MNAAAGVEVNEQFVDLPNNEYILQTVELDDILHDLNLSKDNTAITKSIILSIEEQISEAIKEHLIAALPNVGNLQRNPLNDIFRLHYHELQEARKRLSKEQYRQYVKELRKDIRNQLKIDYIARKRVERLKKGQQSIYKKLLVKRGKAYADLYVAAILQMKYVPFDRAAQEQYDKINGRYED